MQAAADLASLLTEPHIYTHSTRRKVGLVFVLFAVIISLVMAVVNLVSRQSVALMLACAIKVLYFAAMGFILSRSTGRNVLITGLEGIIFTYGSYTVFSPWENITRTASPPYWGGYDALQLREAPADMSLVDGIRERRATMQITRSTSIMMGPKSNSRYNIYHYIPLLFSRSARRKSQLDRDLARYIPTVLQALPQHTLHR